MGAGLVGFQTYEYARHFLSCCARQLGVESTPSGIQVEERFVSVQIFPVGLDYDRINTERQSPAVRQTAETLSARFKDVKLIVGRDKLDHTKGLKHKMLAFERFLTDFPQWRGKVVLLQITIMPHAATDGDVRSPTPTGSLRQVAPLRGFTHPDTRQLIASISEVVNRVNARFGSFDYTPIIHAQHEYGREEELALFSIADLCLVTAVRDGMNLTCQEYVVCQQEKHSPLLVSEFTGSAGSLGSAILINPWDYNETANAINQALKLTPQEQLTKYLVRVKCERDVLY